MLQAPRATVYLARLNGTAAPLQLLTLAALIRRTAAKHLYPLDLQILLTIFVNRRKLPFRKQTRCFSSTTENQASQPRTVKWLKSCAAHRRNYPMAPIGPRSL